jgi:hypothetical protein
MKSKNIFGDIIDYNDPSLRIEKLDSEVSGEGNTFKIFTSTRMYKLRIM